jgi:hypothetical protein
MLHCPKSDEMRNTPAGRRRQPDREGSGAETAEGTVAQPAAIIMGEMLRHTGK